MAGTRRTSKQARPACEVSCRARRWVRRRGRDSPQGCGSPVLREEVRPATTLPAPPTLLPWSVRPGDAGDYHRAMPQPPTIRIEAFHLADFIHPVGSDLAGRSGLVMGYAVVHPDGVVLFDTGIGFGSDEIETAFQPGHPLAAGPAPGARDRPGRRRRASPTRTCTSTTAARTWPSRDDRSTPRRPNTPPPVASTTRSRTGSTSRAPATSSTTATLELLPVSDSSPRPDTRPDTSRCSSRAVIVGRRSSARRSGRGPSGTARTTSPTPGPPAPGTRWRTGRRWRGFGRSSRTSCYSVTTIGGSIPVRAETRDLWGCVVSTGPGYRGTRAEDATGPR